MYDFNVGINKVVIRNGTQKLYVVHLGETDVQTDSEAMISGLPTYGRIVGYRADVTDGTISPGIGRSPDWVAETIEEIAQSASDAAHIDDQTVIKYYSGTGQLVIRSTPSGNGNDITTEILIEEGWGV